MKREMRVGILFLAVALAFAYMVSRLGQRTGVGGEKKTYYALVADSSGLIRGAPIRVAGIDVGGVENKSLEEDKARLTLNIQSGVPIHADAKVSLRTIGYLGDRYVELDPGTEDAPPLKEGAMIPVRKQGATLEDIMAKSTELIDQWTEAGRRLSKMIGG
jgi:phospholipid/cholesterol/gamma-HCH transport system substrate-binding protein